MPHCPGCGMSKPRTEFVRNRANKSGFHTYCKPCHNAKVKESIRKHHGSERRRQLTRRYGVDNAQVAWLVLQQDGRCAICRRGAARHVDHCHLSGKVRAVLCFNCNGGLGKTQERLDLLQHAADYLEGQHGI